jgi:hypothetical protein
MRREGLVVAACGYVAHALLSLVMRVPVVMYDEYGYFATARYLAGEGQVSNLKYHPGYAFLLVPAFVVTESSDDAYRLILLTVNAGLGALTTWLAWRLVTEFAPDLGRDRRLIATAIVSVYPSWLLFTNLTWSENLLVPVVAGLVLGALRVSRGVGPLHALAFGVLGGSAYLVHPRGIAFAAASVAVVIVVAPAARRFLTIGLVALGAGIVVYATPRLTRAVTSSGGYSRETFLQGFGLEDTPAFFGALGGHLFYLSAATYGVAPLGVAALVLAVRAHGRRAQGALALAALAIAAAGLVVSGVFWHHPFRSDQLIYGRYNEAILMPVLAAGVVALVRRAVGVRVAAIVMLGPIAVLWVVPYVAFSEAVRATLPVSVNILGVAPLVSAAGVEPLNLAIAHGAAAVAVLVAFARGPALAAPVVLLAGMLTLAAVLEWGLFTEGSAERAAERRIAAVLRPLEPGCVGSRRGKVDVIRLSLYRVTLDGWRFEDPDVVPDCGRLLVSDEPDAAVLARTPGARVLQRELRSANVLWEISPAP